MSRTQFLHIAPPLSRRSPLKVQDMLVVSSMSTFTPHHISRPPAAVISRADFSELVLSDMGPVSLEICLEPLTFMAMGDLVVEFSRDTATASTIIMGHCYLGIGVLDDNRGVKLLSLA